MNRWVSSLGGLALVGVLVGMGCEGETVPATTDGGDGGMATGGEGGGGGETCNPATCPDDDATECRVVACIGETCGYTDMAEGTACTEGVCDPVGHCVECNITADCAVNEMCAGNECIPFTCNDSIVNGMETDVDCGGAMCPACTNGKTCAMAADCSSHFCNVDICAACQPGDCNTGEYCDAGACVAQKVNGSVCNNSVECSTAHCTDGVCCDMACAGLCASCAVSGSEGTCTAHALGTDPDGECGTDVCNGAGECRCDDNTMNGAETDVDCGGAVCAGCMDGLQCNGPSDCLNGVCINGTCSGACNNTVLDPGETDVDCGGANCPSCGDGLLCNVPGDCMSHVCSTTCQAPTCFDTVTNGSESDVDCGGSCIAKCPDNSNCNAPSDCQSMVCFLDNCEPPTCVDTIRNGAETDIDCGGPTCPDCGRGQLCTQGTDCVSGICNASNLCACSPALNALNDGSGVNGGVGLPNLVMSEIRPGSYIELYNTTGANITLGAAAHWLCSPFVYVSLAALAPTVVVPAGGYAILPWPANFTDISGGGEVMLYANSSFNDNTAILDFTCWGINPHGSRKSQAEAIGKWSGACNGALANGSIHRLASTTGITAAAYNTAAPASPMSCTP